MHAPVLDGLRGGLRRAPRPSARVCATMDSTAAVAKDLYRQTRRGSSSKSSRRVNVQEGSKGSAAARRAKLERFTKIWLERLLQQQVETQEAAYKVARLEQHLASELSLYKAQVASTVDRIMAPPAAPAAGHGAVSEEAQLKHKLSMPPRLDLTLLDVPEPQPGAAPMDTGSSSSNGGSNGSSSSSAAGRLLLGSSGGPSPESQLAKLMSSIEQAKSKAREVDTLYTRANSHIQLLQEGAADRDRESDDMCSALLQYADELEARARAEAAAMAAWEAEQARAAAERAAWEAEQARLAEAEAQRAAQAEAAQRAAADAAAAEAAAEAARLEDAARLEAAKPIKIDVGVQVRTKPGQDLVLVGSHALLGAWDVKRALRLAWSEGHVWRASLELPAGGADNLEYKAVLINGKAAVWEKGSNHKADLLSSKELTLYHVFKG